MRANHQSNGTAGLREDVSAFGASAAATSLLLLRQVEEKVDSCKASTEVAFGLAHICDIVIDAVRKGHLQGELDPEDKVISVYDVALDALSQKNEELKHSIRNCEKYGPHKGDLVDAYRKFRDAIICLFDAMTELKTAIMEHDANQAGEVVGSFDTVEELIASIASK